MTKAAVSEQYEADGEIDYEVDESSLEVMRWANEVYAEMKHVGLRAALALANEPAENLGEEDLPL